MDFLALFRGVRHFYEFVVQYTKNKNKYKYIYISQLLKIKVIIWLVYS